MGAGPAGLAAAILAARAGLRAVVHERCPDVGGRFHDDFQGLENWSSSTDVCEELAAAGIAVTFDHFPVREQVGFDPGGREFVYRSREPFYYLVRRGPGPGTLDRSLRDQAIAAGAELRFGESVDHLPHGGLVARGPRAPDMIAAGYVFATDLADGGHAVLDDRLAPKGYAYLLAHGGRGTLGVCLFTDFHNARSYLDRATEFFRSRRHFAMDHPRRFGGMGNAFLPRSGVSGEVVFAGEAAGFQDALWGFGMRHAIRSGVLAARSVAEGAAGNYDRMWKEQLGDLVRASIVNRYVYARLGNRGYGLFLRWLARPGSPRDRLRWLYGWAAWKAPLYAIANRAVQGRAAEPPHRREGCDCAWCRSGETQLPGA